MIHAHRSITNDYIKDYINLTHRVYPSFISKLSSTYYSLDVTNSNMNEDLLSIYKDVSDPKHGGKYSVIYNVPLHTSTNSNLENSNTEKGAGIIESSKITVNMDPLINIVPKTGDLLCFNTEIASYFGVYRVTNIDTSSTIMAPYTRLSIELVPNVTIESLKRFVIEELAFVTNYHHIFRKGDTLLIISLQKKIDEYVNYFNEIYNHKLDAHVDYDHRVFLEFEKALNDLFSKYMAHTNMLHINRSFLCDNLLNYYDENNIFTQMLDPNKTIDTSVIPMCTTSIRRLDKTRRRTINNKAIIYRLLNSNSAKDKIIMDNPILPKYTIDNINALADYSKWSTITSEKFLLNVKDQMSSFIENDCVIDKTNMFGNAIRLSQIFYILDHLVKNTIKNFPTDNKLGLLEHGS